MVEQREEEVLGEGASLANDETGDACAWFVVGEDQTRRTRPSFHLLLMAAGNIRVQLLPLDHDHHSTGCASSDEDIVDGQNVEALWLLSMQSVVAP